jgi:hypothetical protein
VLRGVHISISAKNGKLLTKACLPLSVYAYQGALNAAIFNGRTRALVALLTGLGSIIGSIIIGFITDLLPFSRRVRALWATAFVFALNILVWGGGLGFQVKFTRDDVVEGGSVMGTPVKWDWTDSVAGGPIILLMSYYIADAAFQGLAYFTMSSMSNDPFKLARMAGYYKGVQSAGSAVSFGMDAVATAFLGEHLLSWMLLVISLPLCALVLWHTRDTNYDVEKVIRVEDLSDGAVDGVALPKGHEVGTHLPAAVAADIAVEEGKADPVAPTAAS